MSAVEEYRKYLRPVEKPRPHTTHHVDCGCLQELADAAVAELESQVERLRVCGNCVHMEPDNGWCATVEKADLPHETTMYGMYAYDHCHFTPSRWDERGDSHESATFTPSERSGNVKDEAERGEGT